jgi:hypothetical protein
MFVSATPPSAVDGSPTEREWNMNVAVVERIVEGIAFVGFFTSAVLITKILADNWTKRRLTASQLSDETIRMLYASDQDGTVGSALRWGLVICGLGAALVVIQFLPYDFTDPIAYGLMLLFGGGGLLAHHALMGGGNGPGEDPASPSGPED